jgi:DNA-binding Lrp family transcriptional regulator
MRSKLDELVNQIKGLRSAVVDVVTETPRHALRTLTLPMPAWSPAFLPAPVIELDDLDHRLIERLATSGDESNRELARRLEVSDGTVRARIRRLEDAGLLRVVAGVDPIATGDLRATALVFLTLERSDAADALISSPRVLSAYRCLGSADLALLLGSRREHSLDAFILGEVRGTAGVRAIEVAHLVEVFAHQNLLVRLVG